MAVAQLRPRRASPAGLGAAELRRHGIYSRDAAIEKVGRLAFLFCHPGLDPRSRCLLASEEAGCRVKPGMTESNWIASMKEAVKSAMPAYEAIETGVSLKAVASDLLAFRWQTNGLIADFILPHDDAHALRVSFDRPCIVRLSDEMAVSTEEQDTPNEGLVPNHFAYRLEGARFSRSQSETWKEVSGPVTHYQFVTGWACLDVLSGGSPSFSVVIRTT